MITLPLSSEPYSPGNCYSYGVSDRRQENVLLQYSEDGGTSWHLLRELHSQHFTSPRYSNAIIDHVQLFILRNYIINCW